MSEHNSDADSDLDYDPAVGDSDGSVCDSETSVSSESDEDYDEPIEPIVDAGWVYLTNPFEDCRPEARPLFAGSSDDRDPANLTTDICPSFSSPKDAFMHIFYNDVVDACKWMNERADKCIEETGKRKINAVMWAPVDTAEM